MKILFSFILCFSFSISHGQSIPEITLKDIWINLKFNGTTIEKPQFKNQGSTYTILQENEIVEYDLVTGIKNKVILKGSEIQGLNNFMGSISGYKFSNNEDIILISSEQERVNRRTTRSRIHLYNLENQTVSLLFNKKITHPTFSPDGTKIAFIYNYNLYYKNLKDGATTQVTFDGSQEDILNGIGDWVQQEEFYLDKAYQWSYDGSFIAFYKIDQSGVSSHPIVQYKDQAYPLVENQKYPKPGLAIPVTSIYIYNIEEGKSHEIEIPIAGQYYIPLISWLPNDNRLCLYTLNRPQNQLKSFLYHIKNKSLEIIYEENSITYLESPSTVFYDQYGNQYFISSRDGLCHIFSLALKSKEIANLTPDLIHVQKIYGIDPIRNCLYFQASKEDSRQRQLFSINLKTREVLQLTETQGVHEAWFNKNHDIMIMSHSQFNAPPTYHAIRINEGLDTIRTIESNTYVSELIDQYQIKNPKFFSFNNEDDVKLNGWMIIPPNFDEEKKHPVLMYVYGGPGSQEVLNQWRGIEYWWFQMLAQKGYIIACIDNRGTGGRGTAFKKITQGNLGYYEFQDQLSAAKYLGSLSFIDSERIGIYGWSYGGYLALKCLIEGSSTFSTGISIAPVVDWKWFNAIYSERHMGLPKGNSQGYFNSNLLSRIHLLEDPLLLIHGLADDIVHFQHAAELTKSLISYNKEYEAYLYPNRNHGIYGDNARLHMYSRMTDFIIKNL